MLQRVDQFHDDVKLVLVYSYLTRIMLKNLQTSPVGKSQFSVLMRQAFSWFSQIRQKELLFCDALPEIKEFATQKLSIKDEFESEMVNSLAEITHYVITHAHEEDVHETIAMITNKSYRKGILERAWNAGAAHMNDYCFEDWYKDNFEK